MSNSATLVKRITGWKSDARLYRVDPPMPYYGGADGAVADHVIVSAVVVDYTGPETYIFPSDAEGKPINMLEQEGSYRGGLSHEDALTNAGYEVAS